MGVGVRSAVGAGLLAVFTAGVPQARAQAWGVDTGPEAPIQCERLDDYRSGFERGSDAGRDPALIQMRAIVAGVPTSPVDVGGVAKPFNLACANALLRARYEARSRRQQTWMNYGAGVTGVTGIVAIFADGAGAATQQYWAGAALVPVLLSSWNAYEPTRDLYHGGGLALDFMTARMSEIRYSVTRGAALSAAVPPYDAVVSSCTALRGKLADIEKGADGVAKTDGQAAFAACRAALAGRQAGSVFFDEAQHIAGRLDVLQAQDAISLDAEIRQRDQDLAYSPLETFGALAAAPFEAASSLLSGTNGREAVEALRTQAAFRNLSFRLSHIELPTTVSSLPVFAPNTTNPEVLAVAAALDEVRPHHDRLALHTQRISRLAALDRIDLSYDATTRAVTMTAASGPLPAPPINGEAPEVATATPSAPPVA